MNCDCFDKIDVALGAHNMRLELGMQMQSTGKLVAAFVVATKPRIPGVRTGKRKPIFATFCPFCGTRCEPLETKDVSS